MPNGGGSLAASKRRRKRVMIPSGWDALLSNLTQTVWPGRMSCSNCRDGGQGTSNECNRCLPRQASKPRHWHCAHSNSAEPRYLCVKQDGSSLSSMFATLDAIHMTTISPVLFSHKPGWLNHTWPFLPQRLLLASLWIKNDDVCIYIIAYTEYIICL